MSPPIRLAIAIVVSALIIPIGSASAKSLPASDEFEPDGDSGSAGAPLRPFCYCGWESTEFTGVPSEGILSFRTPSGCWDREITIFVTDAAGEVVPGITDEWSDDAYGFERVLWQADTPPLQEGAAYTYEYLVDDPYGDSYGEESCDREGSLTVREGPFPAMTQPTATLTALTGIWLPEFECYAPSYRVEVTKHAEPDLAPYHRYTISVVRGGEANWIKRQVGDGDPTFDHIADWSTGWLSGTPYQDSYCIRVEAREIVNQTFTTEDLCVTPQDIVGAPTGPGAPWTTVSEDAALCDASVDITNPIEPPEPPPVEIVTSDDEEGGSSRDDGCAGGPVNTVLPAFVFALLLLTRSRRRTGTTGSP